MRALLAKIKRFGARCLGPRRTGQLEYFLAPGRRIGWGGALNGQTFRRTMVEAVLEATEPVALYETGTFRGATTAWLAERTSQPIHTVEADERLAGFSRMRLRRYDHVHLKRDDSRAFLREVVTPGPEPVFAYLDAHWHADLPLAEEIEILFERRPASVVLIDDFEVEGDPGYLYDDYGPGKALVRSYIEPALERFGLGAWYPACASGEESGVLRGSVVLANHERWGATLDSLPTTTRAPYGAGSRP